MPAQFQPVRLTALVAARGLLSRGASGSLATGAFGQEAPQKNADCANAENDQNIFHEPCIALSSHAMQIRAGAGVNNPGCKRGRAQASLGRSVWATPASLGPNRAGIFADLPLSRGCALMAASEKEDAPWLTIHHPEPAAAAVSGFSLQRPSWFFCCFMRCLQAAMSASRQILLQQARPTRRPLSKKQHRPHLRPQLNKTTHHATSKGGRSIASAFGVSVTRLCAGAMHLPDALNTPRTEVSPC